MKKVLLKFGKYDQEMPGNATITDQTMVSRGIDTRTDAKLRMWGIQKILVLMDFNMSDLGKKVKGQH